MKILSLFDGISCARVALERAGIKVHKYYASEIDKYCIATVLYNDNCKRNKDQFYPMTDQLGDVKNIVGFGNIKFDLLIGGFPCTDLSIAKKERKGLKGNESSLFWEMIRIHKMIKPKWFVYENVASMAKDQQKIITETLGVEPIMINASLVSAQNRKRLFWTNIPNVIQPHDRKINLSDICETDVDECYQYRRTYFRRNISGKIPTLTKNMGTGGNNVPYVISASVRGRYLDENGKRKDIYGAKTKQYLELGNKKAHTLTSVDKDSLVYDGKNLRKLTENECELLQGLPINHTHSGLWYENQHYIMKANSGSQRYKMLGNAFNVDVVAHILSFIPKK